MSESYQSLIGKLAPSFTLPNYDGKLFTFNPCEKGVPTAIFVYPESGSFGCTQEACQFRNAIAEKDIFGPERVQIIGISTDSVETQQAFVEKHSLTYPVLSDVKKEAVKALKVGSAMWGTVAVARVTYIIDKKGIVRDTLDATMNYWSHTTFVEKWLKKLEEEDAAAVPKPSATTTAAQPEPEEVQICSRG